MNSPERKSPLGHSLWRVGVQVIEWHGSYRPGGGRNTIVLLETTDARLRAFGQQATHGAVFRVSSGSQRTHHAFRILRPAGIVLARADGLGTMAIMGRTSKSEATVWRFVQERLNALLRGKTRSRQANSSKDGVC